MNIEFGGKFYTILGCPMLLFFFIVILFVHTTSMLRVSFSPVPECVAAGVGIELFRPPRAPRNSVIIIVVIVLYLTQRKSQ